MVFRTDYQIYDALPISNDALDRGGVELLRAGVVDEELFITARPVFARPEEWGYVLADIARRLATIYAAESDFAEAKVSAAIASTFAESLRSGADTVRPYPLPHAGEGREGAKLTKAARLRAKARANSNPSIKAVARRKSARAKP